MKVRLALAAAALALSVSAFTPTPTSAAALSGIVACEVRDGTSFWRSFTTVRGLGSALSFCGMSGGVPEIFFLPFD